jgi:uncharacterized protein
LFKAFAIMVVVGILFVLGVFVWGNLIEPRIIDETRYEVTIPDLPNAWEGERVAFISDIQIGMWMGNEDTVRRIVLRIVKQKPAAVLIGGDFIYHPTEGDGAPEAMAERDEEAKAAAIQEIERAVDLFSPFAYMGIPVYAVLGNHDYAMETRSSLKLTWVAQRLKTTLQNAGIRVLENEAVALELGDSRNREADQPLFLVGIGPYYPDEDQVQKAFSDVPENAARIVMMHNPQSFREIPSGRAPLAVAGHTHGGQIRIPYLPAWSWISIVRTGEVHTDGWIRHYGKEGNQLYVNRGVGFSLFPIRINCAPELTYFTLSGR